MSLILKNIIPQSTWSTILNYITNAVSGLSSYGQYYSLSQTTTTITNDSYLKLSSATNIGSHTSDMSMPTNNKLLYSGTQTKMFDCSASICFVASGAASTVAFSFYKSGSQIALSEAMVSHTGGELLNLNLKALIEMDPDEYLEVWVANSENGDIFTYTLQVTAVSI